MAKKKIITKRKVVESKVNGGMLKQLEVRLEAFFVGKLPGLSKKIKEIIVKLSPWGALVGLLLCLPTLIGVLGISALFSPFYYRYGYVYGYGFISWISALSMILMGLAIPGLFKRQMSAWRLMFYSSLVMALYNLVTFSLGSLIIGTGISMYILFQVKSYYK